jgi:endothelin-converting enzyme/putative endopeptidase
MRTISVLPVLLLISVFAQAQVPTASADPKSSSALKSKSVRFSADMLDKSIDPCTDFYAYACGRWKEQNPIPADRSSWGRFNELSERGEYILKDILEKASVERKDRTVIEQKIGDYYGACTEEAAIEKRGLEPLESDLKAIAAMKSKKDITAEIAREHREGANALFEMSSDSDFKDASHIIANVDQGGMGLPERDYYFRKDEKSEDIRKKYVLHVQKMLELLGDAPEKAAAEAKTVMDIETGLANGALDVVSRRDPNKLYHKMTRAELAALSPEFAWEKYFSEIGAPSFASLNIVNPDFMKSMNALLNSVSLEDWRTYLRWHVVHANANILPKRFEEENFEFFSKTLQGTKEQPPRWKRCVRAVNGDLGEAVGQVYVAQTFGAEGKERTLKMVNTIEASLREDIQGLPWMTAATKTRALEKLAAITNRIGYTDKWRDYASYKVVRDDAFGNSQRGNVFQFEHDMEKIGKPLDKGEWPYPPPTVNATYNPLQNNITFPAGILQPPFYDNQADDAMNFGGIGAVVGHELTHGFDDEGRQFDPAGNLNDWWTKEDAAEFKKRTQCIVDEYSSFTAIDDVKVNGELTLGENTADNGGMRVAYMALLASMAGKEPAPMDGLTAQQRFFLGWANVWCQNRRDAVSRMAAQTDPHAPGKNRVNGVVSNMPEFREAFHCAADAPMVSKNACRVW